MFTKLHFSVYLSCHLNQHITNLVFLTLPQNNNNFVYSPLGPEIESMEKFHLSILQFCVARQFSPILFMHDFLYICISFSCGNTPIKNMFGLHSKMCRDIIGKTAHIFCPQYIPNTHFYTL